MNSEQLTLRRLTTGVVYPPMAFQPVDVNRIYASITERYPYQTLQHLPDGARMASPEGDVFIQQTRVQINESVVHFQSAKEKCMDLFETVQNHLHVPQFMTFGVKLTAFLPMNEAPRAAQFVEQKMLPGIADKLEILGEGRQGVGIRIVTHRESIQELKIEPFFGDLSQLYVELDVQHPTPFNDICSVELLMGDAYSYLFGEVKDFLAAFE